MNSLQGHLLVASPHLPDPNFFRTVVLMVQHNEQGALGLVLNRPTGHRVCDVWNQVSDEPCTSEEPIRLGGPVPGPLMTVHTDRACCEEEILPGMYFAAGHDHVVRIVSQDQQPYRVFSGYAGWGSGQLERELEVGGWLTTQATLQFVFAPPEEDLWKRVLGDIGREILRKSLQLREMPENPSVN